MWVIPETIVCSYSQWYLSNQSGGNLPRLEGDNHKDVWYHWCTTSVTFEVHSTRHAKKKCIWASQPQCHTCSKWSKDLAVNSSLKTKLHLPSVYQSCLLLPAVMDEIHLLNTTLKSMKTHNVEVGRYIPGGYLNRSIWKCITFIFRAEGPEHRKDVHKCQSNKTLHALQSGGWEERAF